MNSVSLNRRPAPYHPGCSGQYFGDSEADNNGNKNHQELEQAHYRSLVDACSPISEYSENGHAYSGASRITDVRPRDDMMLIGADFRFDQGALM